MAISKPEEDFDDEEDLEEEEDEGEEDEEDDLEEEEEDDEIIEVTDFKSTPPRPLGKSPERWTQPQRELVSSLFEMMDHMHTEQACYAVLLETNWDLGDAANHLLDAKHTTAIRTSASPSPMSFNERENLDICHRVQSMEDLASTGVAAAAGDTKESLCNSVRHRLLYEDKKIAWSDGACAVQVCLHSMQTACGDLDAISKPERLLIVECLNRAVGIMLDQPLGPHQENFVYALGVVDAGVEIAVLMLQVKKNPVLLEVLNTALQHDRALWKASAQTHYMKCRAQLLGNQALVQAIFEESSWAANPNEIANQALVFARHAGQSAMAASVVKRRLLEGPLKNDSAMDAVFKELAEAERREVGEDNSTKRGKFDSFYYFWFNEFAMRPFMENVSLEQRLFGLAQLERLVDTLTVMAMQTNNKRAKSTLFPALVGTGNSETDPPPPPPPPPTLPVATKAFSPDLLCEWLTQCDFLRLLMGVSPLHTEILLRSKKVVKFLACENHLSAQQLRELWDLAHAQHESCRVLLLEMISQVLVVLPNADVMQQLFQGWIDGQGEEPSKVLGFVQFLAKLQQGKPFSQLCLDAAKRNEMIQLLWVYLKRADSTEEAFGAIAYLVPLLCQGRHVDYFTRTLREIAEPATESHRRTSFRLVLLLRKSLEADLCVLKEDEEVDRVSQILVNELLREASTVDSVPLKEMLFRMEFIVYLWRSQPRNVSYHTLSKILTQLSNQPGDLALLFLKEVIKHAPHKLSGEDLGKTFLLIRPMWDRVFAQKQSTSVVGVLWECFNCFFRALQRQSKASTSALAMATAMIWQATLEPFCTTIHDVASGLAIRETNTPLPIVLDKILALLRQSIATTTLANKEEDTCKIVSRCLSVLRKLAEEHPRKIGELSNHALSASLGSEIRVSLTLIKDGKPLMQDGAAMATIVVADHLNLRTTMQDLMRFVPFPVLHLGSDRYDVTNQFLTTLEQTSCVSYVCHVRDPILAAPPLEEGFQESARMVLARCDDLFTLLHELEMASDRMPRQIRLEALALLQLLPSRVSVLSLFQTTNQDNVQYVNANCNYGDQVYRLEILHSVLNPASVWDQELAKTIKTRFVTTGGLRSVVLFVDLVCQDLSNTNRDLLLLWSGVRVGLQILLLCIKDVAGDQEMFDTCLINLQRVLECVGGGNGGGEELTQLAIQCTGLLLATRHEPNGVMLDALINLLIQSSIKELRQSVCAVLEDLCKIHSNTIALTVWEKLLASVWPFGQTEFLHCMSQIRVIVYPLSSSTSLGALPGVDKAWKFAQAERQSLLAESLSLLVSLSNGQATGTTSDVQWLLSNMFFCDHPHSFARKPCNQLLLLHCSNPKSEEEENTNLLLLCDTLLSKMSSTILPEYNFDSTMVFREEDIPFAGLINFGATCYLNSLVQQFFMCPFIRDWVGAPTLAPLLIQEQSEKQIQSTLLLTELRRVFAFLQSTKRKAIAPRDLVEMCKHLNLTHSVYSQNDVRDLCDKLVDFIECGLLVENGVEATTGGKLGGKVLHQNIKEGCPHPPTTFFDSFLMLELEIKSKLDLETSLRDYFAVERLDECLECEECKEKFPAYIRNELCLPLPQVLIIQLKRFQFDFDTFETIKLNDRLAFPLEIDLAQYTANDSIPAVYDLCGVLVHRGQAFSGHYYSFSKDRTTGRWYKFNDEKVTGFDLKRLDDECFGGGVLEANGYLLLYEPRTNSGEVGKKPEMTNPEVEADNTTLQIQSVLTSDDCACLVSQLVAQSDKVQQVAIQLYLNWTCRVNTNSIPEFAFSPHRAKEFVLGLQSKLLEMMIHIRGMMLRNHLLALGVCNAHFEMEPMLCELLVQLLCVGEISKLPLTLKDLLYGLSDLLVRKPGAREYMRQGGGLARLVHFYYGGDISPFTVPRTGSDLLLFDGDHELNGTALDESDSNVGGLFPPLDWTWADRVVKWQYSIGVASSQTLQRVWDKTCLVIAQVISPCHVLPLPFHDLKLYPLFFTKFLHDNPAILLPWWIDLCQGEMDNSSQIINDLLHSTAIELDDAKYADALVGVLNITDDWQRDRVAMCFPALLTRSKVTLQKFWGTQGMRGGVSESPKPLGKLTLAEAESCCAHARLLAKLCMHVPLFLDMLRNHIREQQMVEYVQLDDDVTRLLFLYVELMCGGPFHSPVDDTDEVIRILAQVCDVPEGPEFLVCNRKVNNDSVCRHACLGARYLFDDKLHFSPSLLCVVDHMITRPGVITEFQCRMSTKYAKQLSHTSHDPYVCVVLGKRPGDGMISLGLTTNFSLFQRVSVPYAEVMKRQQALLITKGEEEEEEEEEVVITDDKDPVKTTGPRRSKRIKTKQDQRLQQQRENVPGVVIKVLPSSLVIRLDSIASTSNTSGSGGNVAAHSQIVELVATSGDFGLDDPLVVQVPINLVMASQAPLCLLDHPFYIARTAIIPAIDPKQYESIQQRPLSVPVFPGERVGVYRASALGVTFSSQWLNLDANAQAKFVNYVSTQQLVPQQGTCLGGILSREDSRPGFSFRVRDTE